MMLVELEKDPILSDHSFRKYIEENTIDPWEEMGHAAAGYKALDAKQKGILGEKYARRLFEDCNKHLKEATNSGHDYIVDGYKTEVKFSLAQTNPKNKKSVIADCFMINHIGIEKDWERLLFIGINQCNSNKRVYWFSKSDIEKCLELGYIKRQAGGKESDNDDYMCAGKDLLKVLRSKYAHTMDEW